MTKVTDDSIMVTAIKLFKQDGFESVTVNALCRACQITKPTFYYHFKGKEELISRYFRKLVTALPGQLLAQNNHLDPLTKIYQFYEMTIAVTRELGPDLYSQLYITNLKQNQHTFDFSESTNRYVTQLIKDAQQQGLVTNQSTPESLYLNSVLLFEGYELNWCFQQGAFDPVPMVTSGLATLFDVPVESRPAQGATMQLFGDRDD